MNSIFIVMPILIILMFMLGIELNRASFSNVLKKPKAVMIGMLGQIVLLPMIAFLVAWVLQLPPVYFMGLMLIACCPGGSSSNVFSMLAKGDVALSVTLTALSSIITLFTIPPVMKYVSYLVSDISGVEINLPIEKLIVQNILLLFIPLLAGALFKHCFTVAAQRVNKVLGKVAFPALMTLAFVFFLQYRSEIAENITILGLSALLLILLSMLSVTVISRAVSFNHVVRRTLIIEVGMQNAAQAITIASSPFIFNSGEMALPAIIYALLMNVILLIYVCCVKNNLKNNG